MWTIVKFDKKKLNILKNDLTKKIGQNWKIYLLYSLIGATLFPILYYFSTKKDSVICSLIPVIPFIALSTSFNWSKPFNLRFIIASYEATGLSGAVVYILKQNMKFTYVCELFPFLSLDFHLKLENTHSNQLLPLMSFF